MRRHGCGGPLRMLEHGDRQRASLEQTGHRPFPLPRGSWAMGQSWLDLLFAH